MRILHLTTEFPPVIYGGLGTAVGGLVAASARTGIEVAVLLIGAGGDPSYRRPAETRGSPDDPTPTDYRAAGVHLRTSSHHAAEETGVEWVQAWRPDVLHLHSFWLWPVARAIRERTGVPLVYTVHSLDRAEYEIGQGPPECVTQWQTQENAIARADRIVALTRSERELIAAYLPTARERVRVVGNGIDDCPAAREAVQRRRQSNTPLVLYTGRFVERKGVRELLAAIPLVITRAPGTRFVLAGGHRHCSGEDMANYWLPPGFEPYREWVHFTGWLSPDTLARWYREADVLVVPSWYEPFGMVVLEGMLYGLPIAAADVGGPAEILEHEHTGLLCRPRDAGALADILVRLAESPALRRKLGQAAAREVRRTWLYSRVVKRMRAVYEELIMDTIDPE
ncbi:MAG: glycosyltransferase family 4 protein [Methylococcales bacterium]